ncbi:hypothetical protein IMSHALPRED_002665 [Imshaugia aleurites]|uniref:Uncharacterized protein n=1 Tax=Imshaugia aleurites TaxID=172621 RepID=A0A8H3IEK5_9LECA|nr:hypothetical protein IMSHALPRED_002665 [Imshaugia aleurites]
MSNAGNKGIFSNNIGSSVGGFTKRDSSDAGSGAASGSTAERRRSSVTKFAGLNNQKRNSQDVSAAARKASFAEQNKAPGFLGGMWQNWTKGSGK